MHEAERVVHAVDRAVLVQALAEHLPPGCVLIDPEDMRPFECDALSAYRSLPWIVVLPETVDEIRQAMRVCHAHGVPVVARGAGTGLSGGSLPLDNGVLLVLTKLNRILEIDADNRLARVQPGVRNAEISEATKPYGLHYAPDPSSQIACTIGGNVAENSGGVHCLKYGLTVHNVAALRVVLTDGELVSIGGAAWDSAGFDLLALMTGSEGLLGIVVEVTVRLVPIPRTACVLLAAFPDVVSAGGAVAAVIAEGLLPAGLEFMDALAIQATEDFVRAGYPRDAGALLLCEFDGLPEQVDHDIELACTVLKGQGATMVRASSCEAERQRFWAGRKAAFPAVGRIAADYYCMDGTIPRQGLARVLGRIGELSVQYGLRVANVFHAGDGNLHPLILYDAAVSGQGDAAEALGAAILEVCLEAGGTITGEHGVGTEKIELMCQQFGHDELAQFHAIKNAFDPEGLLNPGKAIPALRRCAEFGAMHVHQGRLPHPDLPRF